MNKTEEIINDEVEEALAWAEGLNSRAYAAKFRDRDEIRAFEALLESNRRLCQVCQRQQLLIERLQEQMRRTHAN